MKLLDLPVELLITLPNYLSNIEDFKNVSSTCQILRNALSSTSPNQILRLAAAQSTTFFRPDPHFLTAATVRQVSDWALKSQENTEILRSAMKGGVDVLLKLCVEKAGLTMEDIRRIYLLRFSTLHPIADLIDKAAGAQWYNTPNFWNGGVSDAVTVSCEPTRAMFQIVIYGELFASTMQANLNPELNLPKFDVHMRFDYIRYCIPEWICVTGSPGLGKPDNVGIFAGNSPDVGFADQFALWHVLRCRKWTEAWQRVEREIGEDFSEDWRQKIWHSAVQCQGLEGLEMMTPGGVEKWKERLVDIRASVERLEKAPETFQFGRWGNNVTNFPEMWDENLVCMAGYWS